MSASGVHIAETPTTVPQEQHAAGTSQPTTTQPTTTTQRTTTTGQRTATTAPAGSSCCGVLTFRSPVVSTTALVKKAEADAAAIEAEVQRRVDEAVAQIRAHGGVLPVAESEITTFEAALQRYGAKIREFFQAVQNNVRPDALEAAKILNGLASDLASLIVFFEVTRTALPNTASALTPILAGLEGAVPVLRTLAEASTGIANASVDVSGVTEAITSGNATAIHQSATKVVADVNTGINAAVAAKILPPALAQDIQTHVNDGFRIANTEAQAAQVTLHNIAVSVAPTATPQSHAAPAPNPTA